MSGFVKKAADAVLTVGTLGLNKLVGKAPSAPELQAPDALSKTPTQAEASAKTSQATLDRQTSLASTSTVLNGGQGLTDDPATTSSLLIGV